MPNTHEITAFYKRTTSNGICKFIGENKEKISVYVDCLEDIELIEGQKYLLKIFKNTWELYLTLQIGALRNIISIEKIITDI